MNVFVGPTVARTGLGTVLCEAASAHRADAASQPDRLGSIALPADVLRRMIAAARPGVASGDPDVAGTVPGTSNER